MTKNNTQRKESCNQGDDVGIPQIVSSLFR